MTDDADEFGPGLDTPSVGTPAAVGSGVGEGPAAAPGRAHGEQWGSPSGSVRERVVVCLANDEDERLIVDALSEFCDVATAEPTGPVEAGFDLCIADERTFGPAHENLLTPARTALEFLPCLLISSVELSTLPEPVWDGVDEVLATPVRQGELRVRVEGLLDNRRRYLALQRRNALVEALHEATQRMNGATDPTLVCETAVVAAGQALDLPLTAVWLADETGQRLCPVAQTDESQVVFDDLPAYTVDDDSAVWRAFADGETSVTDDPRTAEDRHDPETVIRSELVVPVGEFGVLLTGSTTPRSFDDNDVHGAELLAANTASALERAEREQALARTTSQLEFFDSILRHDVLNAMTVVGGRAETLVDELEGGSHRRYARTIREWSGDVVDVVTRVRTVVETLTGDAVVSLEPVDLSAVVDDEIASIRTAYPEVTVETAVPADVTVRADALLSDVVGNLLANAVEHNPTDGLSITVTVETGPDLATLRIADTGSGVPEDRSDVIFRRGETEHAKSSGTGFGLFFVDSMVEEYGGTVRVEDTDPAANRRPNETGTADGMADAGGADTADRTDDADGGTGATFVVELPLPEGP